VAAVLFVAVGLPDGNIARLFRGMQIALATALEAIIRELPGWGTDDNIDAWRELLTLVELAPSTSYAKSDTVNVEVPQADSLLSDRGHARLDPDNPTGWDKLDITNDVSALVYDYGRERLGFVRKLKSPVIADDPQAAADRASSI